MFNFTYDKVKDMYEDGNINETALNLLVKYWVITQEQKEAIIMK